MEGDRKLAWCLGPEAARACACSARCDISWLCIYVCRRVLLILLGLPCHMDAAVHETSQGSSFGAHPTSVLLAWCRDPEAARACACSASCTYCGFTLLGMYPFWVSRLCAAVHAAKSDGNMADEMAFCQVHVTLECGCDCCMHRVPISRQAWLMLQVVPMTLQHVV